MNTGWEGGPASLWSAQGVPGTHDREQEENRKEKNLESQEVGLSREGGIGAESSIAATQLHESPLCAELGG